MTAQLQLKLNTNLYEIIDFERLLKNVYSCVQSKLNVRNSVDIIELCWGIKVLFLELLKPIKNKICDRSILVMGQHSYLAQMRLNLQKYLSLLHLMMKKSIVHF